MGQRPTCRSNSIIKLKKPILIQFEFVNCLPNTNASWTPTRVWIAENGQINNSRRIRHVSGGRHSRYHERRVGQDDRIWRRYEQRRQCSRKNHRRVDVPRGRWSRSWSDDDGTIRGGRPSNHRWQPGLSYRSHRWRQSGRAEHDTVRVWKNNENSLRDESRCGWWHHCRYWRRLYDRNWKVWLRDLPNSNESHIRRSESKPRSSYWLIRLREKKLKLMALKAKFWFSKFSYRLQLSLKFRFGNRVVDLWNILLDEVIKATSINSLKKQNKIRDTILGINLGESWSSTIISLFQFNIALYPYAGEGLYQFGTISRYLNIA